MPSPALPLLSPALPLLPPALLLLPPAFDGSQGNTTTVDTISTKQVTADPLTDEADLGSVIGN